jgi:hypothetical protein
MCDYIDAQHHYYKSALEAVEVTKQKVDDYRRYITKVRVARPASTVARSP